MLFFLFLFFFEADFHSSDSSDDDVPCLTGRSIHQEYGRNAAASILKKQKTNKK